MIIPIFFVLCKEVKVMPNPGENTETQNKENAIEEDINTIEEDINTISKGGSNMPHVAMAVGSGSIVGVVGWKANGFIQDTKQSEKISVRERFLQTMEENMTQYVTYEPFIRQNDVLRGKYEDKLPKIASLLNNVKTAKSYLNEKSNQKLLDFCEHNFDNREQKELIDELIKIIQETRPIVTRQYEELKKILEEYDLLVTTSKDYVEYFSFQWIEDKKSIMLQIKEAIKNNQIVTAIVLGTQNDIFGALVNIQTIEQKIQDLKQNLERWKLLSSKYQEILKDKDILEELTIPQWQTLNCKTYSVANMAKMEEVLREAYIQKTLNNLSPKMNQAELEDFKNKVNGMLKNNKQAVDENHISDIIKKLLNQNKSFMAFSGEQLNLISILQNLPKDWITSPDPETINAELGQFVTHNAALLRIMKEISDLQIEVKKDEIYGKSFQELKDLCDQLKEKKRKINLNIRIQKVKIQYDSSLPPLDMERLNNAGNIDDQESIVQEWEDGVRNYKTSIDSLLLSQPEIKSRLSGSFIYNQSTLNDLQKLEQEYKQQAFIRRQIDALLEKYKGKIQEVDTFKEETLSELKQQANIIDAIDHIAKKYNWPVSEYNENTLHAMRGESQKIIHLKITLEQITRAIKYNWPDINTLNKSEDIQKWIDRALVVQTIEYEAPEDKKEEFQRELDAIDVNAEDAVGLYSNLKRKIQQSKNIVVSGMAQTQLSVVDPEEKIRKEMIKLIEGSKQNQNGQMFQTKEMLDIEMVGQGISQVLIDQKLFNHLNGDGHRLVVDVRGTGKTVGVKMLCQNGDLLITIGGEDFFKTLYRYSTEYADIATQKVLNIFLEEVARMAKEYKPEHKRLIIYFNEFTTINPLGGDCFNIQNKETYDRWEKIRNGAKIFFETQSVSGKSLKFVCTTNSVDNDNKPIYFLDKNNICNLSNEDMGKKFASNLGDRFAVLSITPSNKGQDVHLNTLSLRTVISSLFYMAKIFSIPKEETKQFIESCLEKLTHSTTNVFGKNKTKRKSDLRSLHTFFNDFIKLQMDKITIITKEAASKKNTLRATSDRNGLSMSNYLTQPRSKSNFGEQFEKLINDFAAYAQNDYFFDETQMFYFPKSKDPLTFKARASVYSRDKYGLEQEEDGAVSMFLFLEEGYSNDKARYASVFSNFCQELKIKYDSKKILPILNMIANKIEVKKENDLYSFAEKFKEKFPDKYAIIALRAYCLLSSK